VEVLILGMGWDGMGLWIGQCKGECEMEVATGDGGGDSMCLGNHEWEVLSPVGLVGRYCNVEEVGRSGPDSD
jgi:hypothetical protein